MEIGILSTAQENETPTTSPRDRRREEAEIVRALRRYSSREQGSRVPIIAVAAMCGLHRDTVYEAMHGNMGDIARAVLASAIASIERGEVRFRRVGQQWRVEEAPGVRPPPQPRIVLASDYREWSRCQSCGSPAFSPFEGLAGKLYMACDGCVSEPDRMMLGARPR